MSTLLSPAKTYFQEKLVGVLRAICDDPTDDVSRLVYADLLEEYGDESEQARAEYIRLSLQLAGWGADGGSPKPCGEIGIDGFDIDAGARRQGLLLGEYGEEWSRGVAEIFLAKNWGWGGPTCGPKDSLAKVNWDYRRGFVAVVSCTDEEFRKHGPLLVRRCPLEEVRIVDKNPGVGAITLRRGWYGRKGYAEAGQDDNRPNDADDLPLDVWDELVGGRRGFEGGRGAWRWYDSLEEANRDLSSAYLRWARKQPDPTVSNPEGLD